MRTRYTLQELRALGVETVGRSVILGVGQYRRQVRAVGNEVTLNLADMASEIGGEAALTLGAKLAELEAKPFPEPPKKLTKNAGLTLGTD